MGEVAMLAERRSRRLALVLVINAVVVVAQVVAGLAAHSLGLLADAGHNLTDIAALGLSLLAVRLTRRRPTAVRSFGYHRSTVLAALANAAGLLAVTVLVSVAAIDRLLHPRMVRGGLVFLVALAALALNGASAWLLHERDGHDLNMRAALLHMAGDAGSAGGVAVTGAIIFLVGGLSWLDPAMSLVIAGLIAVQAIVLVREATDVLLESTPVGLDIDHLVATAAQVPGVEEIHDVHAWSLSSEVKALSAHLVLAGHPTLEEAQAVGECVKEAIARFGIAHATLELECETCVSGRDDPCAMDGFSAARTHS
jgi:cobalt-zinc-cadmium efflux system protein